MRPQRPSDHDFPRFPAARPATMYSPLCCHLTDPPQHSQARPLANQAATSTTWQTTAQRLAMLPDLVDTLASTPSRPRASWPTPRPCSTSSPHQLPPSTSPTTTQHPAQVLPHHQHPAPGSGKHASIQARQHGSTTGPRPGQHPTAWPGCAQSRPGRRPRAQ